MAHPPRIVLLQTAIGDYRQQVLEILCGSEAVAFSVLAGPVHFDGGTFTRVHLGDRLQPVTNHFFLKRKLLWQWGGWGQILKADAAIIEFNPRILSNWVLLPLRKLLRRPNALWGHAWPRSGKESRSKSLRKVMAGLADSILVYTETEAEELRQYITGIPIIAAPNALYRRSQMAAVEAPDGATDFIYVGRLVKAKKPDHLVRAFVAALDRLPPGTKLIMVGEGPMRPELEKIAAATPGRVEFHGHVADWDRLRELYARSLASVSPGYVGLSITQSFSFGVPMIVSRNEPHAPEIEATREEENSIFFETDNISSLSEALCRITRESPTWRERRESIAADCRARYSAEIMAERLLRGAGVSPSLQQTAPAT